jgi:predicted Fe-S protein YdhL (DUF1289 family)
LHPSCQEIEKNKYPCYLKHLKETKMNDDHANLTNPCVGICVSDDNDMCIGCYRTQDERASWYSESKEWRETVLADLPKREENVFGRDI